MSELPPDVDPAYGIQDQAVEQSHEGRVEQAEPAEFVGASSVGNAAIEANAVDAGAVADGDVDVDGDVSLPDAKDGDYVSDGEAAEEEEDNEEDEEEKLEIVRPGASDSERQLQIETEKPDGDDTEESIRKSPSTTPLIKPEEDLVVDTPSASAVQKSPETDEKVDDSLDKDVDMDVNDDDDKHEGKVDENKNEEDKDDNDKEEDAKDDDHGDRDTEPYIPQSHTIVIPSYSSWFNFRKIHPIEKESLPEFFTNSNPSKTPALYVKYRNFLINAYRLNPNDYLTVTAARRTLAGDVGTIMRLHRFLSRWGLINYQVDAEVKPKPVEPPYTGDYQVGYDAPRGLFPYESFKPPLEPNKLEKIKDIINGKRTTDEKAKESTENGSDTTHVKAEREIKKPRLVDTINDGWTKEDLKKLLEGLSKFKTDWDAIASYVGTHTVEQCIIRFLKLPIEDKYLENSTNNLGPLKYAPYLPFSQADNPVLSTVAFLVSLVDPDVVRGATERAIKIIDERDLEKQVEQETKDQDGDLNVNALEDAAKVALATVGARAHVFKTMEEIEMNKLTNVIVNTQLNKIELKLSRLERLEKQIDAERRTLQKQQEELFLDRLSFAKVSQLALSKLSSATNLEGDSLKDALEDVKELLDKPPRTLISSFDLSKRESSVVESQEDELDDESLKPVSIETPQTYRYWSC